MSHPITGVHLHTYTPDGKNVKTELETCGEWVANVPGKDFESISNEISQCKHKDRHRKLEPVLKALRYKADEVRYQILRGTSTAWVTSEHPAYLIPLRPGSVWDMSTAARTLTVGEMVYFDKPIVIEAGMDFLLVTER